MVRKSPPRKNRVLSAVPPFVRRTPGDFATHHDPQILLRIEAKLDPVLRKLRRLMKTGMIFARKTTWRSRVDLEYLDETSSRKVSARPQHDDSPKRTQTAAAIRRLRLEGNSRPGSRGRIPAPPDPHRRGRQPHGAVATYQRRSQEAHFRGVVRAHQEIFNLFAKSRPSVSPRFLDVARAARQAGRSRNQSRPRVAVRDEEHHAEVQRAVSSGGPTGFPTGFTTTRTIFTSMSLFARARREEPMWDAARPGILHRDTRTR